MNSPNIIYEDDFLLICEKPTGFLSELSNKDDNIISLLKSHYGESAYLAPLQRLDRNVDGLMLFSKSKRATAPLTAQLQNHDTFVKEYLAVVHGAPETKTGEYTDFLFKDSSKNKTYTVKRLRKGAKEARLVYDTVATAELDSQKLSLVKIRLLTGRTHQIRVQFASRKMPVLGDGKYGSKTNLPFIALHSYRLCFTHPITGKTVDCSLAPKNVFPWNVFI